MKTIKKFNFLLTMLLICPIYIEAQTDSSAALKIGGISFKEQTVLEKAKIGVLYEFEQQVQDGKDMVNTMDTLLLAIGKTHSVFLDPRYKDNLEHTRKERRSGSRQASRVNTMFENQTIDNFTDLLNAGSDYKEENIGYPVQI